MHTFLHFVVSLQCKFYTLALIFVFDVNILLFIYQCLLAFNMPHKVKKLVVAGSEDSEKTSWSNIFHRLIPANFIASLTNERQFSAAMITNETQLVIVDEWSATRMESDLAKCILQGGWMITAVNTVSQGRSLTTVRTILLLRRARLRQR
jgi:hypothetical protein